MRRSCGREREGGNEAAGMESFEKDDQPARELYALLHLSPEASDDDIKKAYRQWAQVYHPDKHQTPQVASPAHRQSNLFFLLLVVFEASPCLWRRELGQGVT